uniref:Complex III subunit 9 n=1 Tax=Plectus sambesii TaxID=2011161 RepID=A0A914WFL1_9BILA
MAGGLATVAYNSVFKRFSTTLLALAVGGFAFEFLFNKATDTYWDSINRGKQWKDLKHRYANKPSADE